MNESELKLELIASLYDEQLKISNIMSELNFDAARMSRRDLCQELELSEFRRAELSVTEQKLSIVGANR